MNNGNAPIMDKMKEEPRLHQIGMDEVLFRCAVCGDEWLFNPLMFKDSSDLEKRALAQCPGTPENTDLIMTNDELEAYLRKHTLNGAMRELHDAWMALWRAVIRDGARLWLEILNTLGM